MKMGYVKLFRCLIDWEWFDDPVMVKSYIYMILKANHDPKKWKGMTIERGQFVTSFDALSKDLKVSKRQIRTIVSRLVSTGEITKKSTNQYTVITIEKYADYQDDNVESDKRKTNERQTKDNPTTTNKNEKNEKNEKNIYISKDIYGELVDSWNAICTSLPSVKSISEARKKKLKARLNSFNQDMLVEGFRKLEASDFCTGRTSSDWKASFDWFINSDGNVTKVLEGNYDNGERKQVSSYGMMPNFMDL